MGTTIEENMTRRGLHKMAYICNMSYVYGCRFHVVCNIMFYPMLGADSRFWLVYNLEI